MTQESQPLESIRLAAFKVKLKFSETRVRPRPRRFGGSQLVGWLQRESLPVCLSIWKGVAAVLFGPKLSVRMVCYIRNELPSDREDTSRPFRR